MYLCRKLLDISLPKIGEQFGGRDHSTVFYAVSKIEKTLKKETSFQQEIEEIEEQIKSHWPVDNFIRKILDNKLSTGTCG